jgi:transposase
MKPKPEVEFAAFAGIDWADAKHDICLQAGSSEEREWTVVPHRAAAIDTWANTLRQRVQGRPVAVCLELAKGPLVYALQKHDFLVLFPVHPATLAKYRQAFTPSRAKADPTDAELALELLLRYRAKLKPLTAQSGPMRMLLRLVEQRRRLVGDQNRISSRLIDALKQYFPDVLAWFADRDTLLFCDFLTRWPTLKQLQRARRATLLSFFHEHHVRSQACIEERLHAIKSATPVDRRCGGDQTQSTPGARPGRTVARDAAGHRELRCRDRDRQPNPARLRPVSRTAGCRCNAGSPTARRLR